MKPLCTLSDSKYLNKGLTLYDSLLRHTKHEEFTLYYLCCDSECYTRLVRLGLPYIIPVDIREVAELRRGSKDYIERRNDTYAWTRDQEWFWSLASRFCVYLVDTYRLRSIMYMDSDLMFYSDVHEVNLDIGPRQIGITPHLHNNRDDPVGAYNVGCIFFGIGGYDCLRWWKNMVCNPRTRLYSKYGTCGDQKWLDLFEDMWPAETKVIGTRVMQTAPWNVGKFNWSEYKDTDRKLIYNGKLHLHAWHHFSHFWVDYTTGEYRSGTANYGNFLSESTRVRWLYDEYRDKCLETHRKYGI